MCRRLLLLLLLIVPVMQAFAQPDDTGYEEMKDILRSYRISYLSQETGLTLTPTDNLLLYDTIATWLGTPYKYAGNGEEGIDCSGFVNILCNRVYGKKLGARNSAEIFKVVKSIKKDELKEGDLVFFKTGRRRSITHIGLYLSQNKFVHSSSSRGVIISDLDEEYYKRHFAGAGRIPNDLAEESENN